MEVTTTEQKKITVSENEWPFFTMNEEEITYLTDVFGKMLKAKKEENTKYELLQRLEGMKNHVKLCHGDFNPSNVIIKEDGTAWVIDWAHVTQGNASADAARTFLLFSIDGKSKLADKYLDVFCEKSGIAKSNVQRWIPIVAATQMTKGKEEEQEFLSRWIEVVDYE